MARAPTQCIQRPQGGSRRDDDDGETAKEDREAMGLREEKVG